MTKLRNDRDWLIEGGEQGDAIRAKDWSNTALGPLESWPQSLRTTVSLCLSSNFPINIIWGRQHEQIYNDGYRVVCGDAHPKALGWSYRECWASAWPTIGEPFERALKGETQFLENKPMFLERNGYLEETFFTFGLSPIRDETGGIGGIFHPVTETTEQMLAERRIRALRDLGARATGAHSSEDAMQRVVETLAEHALDLPFVLIYLLDPSGARVRLVAHTGLPVDGPASPSLVSLDEESASWPFAEVLRDGCERQVEALERLFGTLNCGPYPESPHTAFVLPIMLPGGEHPAGLVITASSPRLPINDSYRAFFKLMCASVTTALANTRAYEAERARAEKLAELDRAKTTFFSNISHEFRTPLTLMLGPIEELASQAAGALTPAQATLLDLLQRNSQRLLRLVNALLDFSRIEAGRMRACFTRTDVAAYTEELASQFRSAMEKSGLEFKLDCRRIEGDIYVDPEMWEKIVVNLLSNALKFTLRGSISLSLADAGDSWQLIVADTGCGIPKAELPKLFQRFHRVQGTRSRSHEGTGIGLAMALELARQHGGEITVTSVEGSGSCFIVTLPKGRGHLPADQIFESRADFRSGLASSFAQEAQLWMNSSEEAATDRAPEPAKDLADGEAASAAALSSEYRPHILLADDNADLRAYVSRLLGNDYRIDTVVDGQAALEFLALKKPDLLLTDVMMPRLDGMGLLQAVRLNPGLRTLPVIMLSARAGEEAALEGLSAGADDYLVKPFSAQELLARVRTHVTMARQRDQLLGEAARVNEELESFSYSVSHDLRGPLRAVDGYAWVLQDEAGGQLDDIGREYLQKIRNAATHMGRIIDDLLRLSRIGRADLNRQTVDLSALAEVIVENIRLHSPERQVQFSAEPGLIAQADPGLIRIVLENLLANAWKYTRNKPQPSIHFGAEVTSSGSIEYFVQDNGAGFDMRFVKALFGMFKRLHTAEDFEGTGIGLVIVKRIILRHGGQVRAVGAPDEGACFFFTLASP